MLCGAVCVSDGKPVLHRILGNRIVVRVINLLVHNGLQGRILGGINLKSAGVKKIAGLTFRVIQLIHQFIDDLLNEFVRKIAVMTVSPLGSCIHVLYPVVYIIGQGFLLLGLGDITLLIHILEYDSPAFRIVFAS